MNDKRTFFTLAPLVFAALPILVALTLWSSPVRAQTITVTTTEDELNADGDCSLREAIVAANTDTAVDACDAGGADDVIMAPPGHYVLSLAGADEDAAATGDLDIIGAVTIDGAGMGQTIVDGAAADRIFDVHDGAELTVAGLTLQNGAASSGGGISAYGNLTLRNSRITGSVADGVGGAIYATGLLEIDNSRLDNNQANTGGALFISFLTAVVDRTEISGNSAEAGGGVYNSGMLILTNSTVSDNTATGSGGGILAVESPYTHLYNVTISDNNAGTGDDGDGGGVYASSRFSAANSIIAANHDHSSSGDVAHDCKGTLESQGYNLLGDPNSCTIIGDASGNLVGVDPLLGPLQNNGGSTLTHALEGGSPALNGGNPAGCFNHDGELLGTDQRGFDRPGVGGPRCDIGAYEAGDALATPTPTATSDPQLTPTPTSTPDPAASERIYLPAITR